MDIHGYPLMDIHGYPWLSMDIHGFPWISVDSMDIHGYPWILLKSQTCYFSGLGCPSPGPGPGAHNRGPSRLGARLQRLAPGLAPQPLIVLVSSVDLFWAIQPKMELVQDRGLSSPTCHTSQYKRAIPAGWQLAPYNREILYYPWSAQCLLFKNGQAYGTKSYGINRNCGGQYLVKKGNKYYATGGLHKMAIVIRQRRVPH